MASLVGIVSLSHPAMYFPAPPDANSFVENVIDVSFKPVQGSTDQEAVVVFKLKCSAPSKFHVRPRVGAILVNSDDESLSTTAIFVSLKDDGCSSASANVRSPCVSLAARSSATLTPGTGGSRDYQERFALDAYYLVGSRFVEAAKHGLAASSKRNSELQQLHDDASNGVLGEAAHHLRSVGIKVFLDNVCFQKSATPAVTGEMTVVPQDAKVLVRPIAQQQRIVNGMSPTSQQPGDKKSPCIASPAAALSPTTTSPTALASTVAGNSSAIAEETRRLKDELQRLESAIIETERDKRVLERGVAGSSAMLAKQTEASGSAANVRKANGKRRGVPFVVVLVLMILTFSVSLFFRIRSGGSISNPFSLSRSIQPDFPNTRDEM